MSGEVDAAIARLGALAERLAFKEDLRVLVEAVRAPRCEHGSHIADLCAAAVARAEEDERPALADATRERLRAILSPHLHGEEIDPSVDAILAEYAPVASKRERLVEVAREFIVQAVGEDLGPGMTLQAEEFAAAVLSSGAVEDATEVARAAAERAWDEARSAGVELVNTGAGYTTVRHDAENPYRAASSREVRPEGDTRG